MKVNLYSFKACLCATHRGAPWGDITRAAGLLGRAKKGDFRINAHKVGDVVNSRGGDRLLDHSWHGRHHAKTILTLNHHLHGLTPMPSRLCRAVNRSDCFI
jgi:hypothetical protein